MAEGARLESVYTETYRGFESLPHRHFIRGSVASVLLKILDFIVQLPYKLTLETTVSFTPHRHYFKASI